MRVLLGVCAYMDIIVDFVPEQFTYAAEKKKRLNDLTAARKAKAVKIFMCNLKFHHLTTVLTFQVSVNFPESLERLYIKPSLLKR